jgi:aryl-alcohol dehydrogenase-like predicted oxidoreductase
MESVHASLKRLNTDYLDLYQMHRFDYETPLEESLSAFDDLIRQGKVHYIGFSEWDATQISSALKIQDAKGYTRFISSQPQYSMLWRVIESKVDPLCRNGKKPPKGSRATDKKGGANMISRWMKDDVLTAVEKLKPIAEKEGLTQAQLAVAWVLQNPNISSAIIGATKPSQIKENVKASGVKLSSETMKAIDSALGNLPERDAAKTVSPNPRA